MLVRRAGSWDTAANQQAVESTV